MSTEYVGKMMQGEAGQAVRSISGPVLGLGPAYSELNPVAEMPKMEKAKRVRKKSKMEQDGEYWPSRGEWEADRWLWELP